MIFGRSGFGLRSRESKSSWVLAKGVFVAGCGLAVRLQMLFFLCVF